MYSFEVRRRSLGSAPQLKGTSDEARRVPQVVYWIGLSSLLADISAESVATALPIFLYSALQLSPLQVGFLDGLYQGGAALVRVAAGHLADTRYSNKAVAMTGYVLSMIARLALLLGGQLGMLFALLGLCLDRVGKGIRTAPRDAIIAGHANRSNLGAAFGVHRSLDAVGALVGPLVAAGMLWWLPFRFDWLFAASFAFAASGIWIFRKRVAEQPRSAATTAERSEARRGKEFFLAMKALFGNKSFVRLNLLAAVLSTFTVSDGLVYLVLQREAGIDERWVPLMFASTAFVFLGAASPVGRLADRVGSLPVFLFGYFMLGVSYLWLAFGIGQSALSAALVIILLGVHYASTDGVLAAFASRVLHDDVRTVGLAVLATTVGLTRLGSSALYGWLWQAFGPHLALVAFASGMTCCCLAVLLTSRLSSGKPVASN